MIDAAAPGVFTPDDVLAGRLPEGHVVIYDDDQYYMAGAIAEKLVQAGRQVTFVTPGLEVSSWTVMTDEQFRVQTPADGGRCRDPSDAAPGELGRRDRALCQHL